MISLRLVVRLLSCGLASKSSVASETMEARGTASLVSSCLFVRRVERLLYISSSSGMAASIVGSLKELFCKSSELDS